MGEAYFANENVIIVVIIVIVIKIRQIFSITSENISIIIMMILPSGSQFVSLIYCNFEANDYAVLGECEHKYKYVICRTIYV